MPLKDYSDEEMLLLLLKNKEEAVFMVFDKYWETLYLSAFSIVKDRFLAEDIVQETIIAIWNKRTELSITYSLKAYLFASVRYASYKKWRKLLVRQEESLEEVEIADSHSPFEALAYQDLKSKIDKVVNDLPLRCKEVYLLSREDQLSHKEIAERMNISTKTVESHLTKALRILRLSIDNLSIIAVFLSLFK